MQAINFSWTNNSEKHSEGAHSAAYCEDDETILCVFIENKCDADSDELLRNKKGDWNLKLFSGVTTRINNKDYLSEFV